MYLQGVSVLIMCIKISFYTNLFPSPAPRTIRLQYSQFLETELDPQFQKINLHYGSN